MPRTKEQNQRIVEARKKEIIKASIQLFATCDYKEVSIDTITNKLGISHGLFYHYFKNKNDLVTTIVKYAKENIIDKFLETSLTYSGEEFFHHYFASFIKLAKNKEGAILLNFLNNIITEKFRNQSVPSKSELERFYNSVIYKKLLTLHEEGKLIQGMDGTMKHLLIISHGICALAKEDRFAKLNLSPSNIIKTFIKTEE